MVDDTELILKLHRRGNSIDSIADITELPVHLIKSVLSTERSNLPDEEELRERSLRLTNEAFDIAFQTLRIGPAPARQALVRTLVSNAGKSLGKDSASDLEDLRLALERVLTQNRLGTSPVIELSESNEPIPPPLRSYNPDEAANS